MGRRRGCGQEDLVERVEPTLGIGARQQRRCHVAAIAGAGLVAVRSELGIEESGEDLGHHHRRPTHQTAQPL